MKDVTMTGSIRPAAAIAALAATALGLAVSDLSAQNRGLEVLHGAADRYATVETLCAEFTQQLTVPLLGSERTGTGRVCQGMPNLFAMRFDDPQGDLIVVDGEFAWVYFPSNDEKTVLRTSADRSAGGRDFHREFLQNPEARYEVTWEGTEEIDGRTTHRLAMVPRQAMDYRAATVWVEQGTEVLRRLRLEYPNGNIRTITLREVEFDIAPSEGFFSFSPPDGALVVSR